MALSEDEELELLELEEEEYQDSLKQQAPIVKEQVEPIDIAKEEDTSYSMGKFVEDTGDVLSNIASIPSALYETGKFAIQQAPEEYQKIKQKPLQAAEQATKKFTKGMSLLNIPEELTLEAEKVYARNLPEFLGGLSEEEYKNIYEDRSTEDLIKATREREESLNKDFPLTGIVSELGGTTVTTAPMIALGLNPTLAYGGAAALKTGSEVLGKGGSFQEALREGSKQLATQAAADALTFGAGRMLAKGKEAIKKLPASQTLRSVGIDPENIKMLEKSKKVHKDPEVIAQELEKAGVAKAFRSKEAAVEALDNAIVRETSNLDNIIKKASNEIKASNPMLMSNVVDDIVKDIDDVVLKNLATNYGKVDEFDKIVYTVNLIKKELKNLGDVDATTSNKIPNFEQVNIKKREIGENVKKWDSSRDKLEQEALKDIYHIVNENLKKAAKNTSVGDSFAAQNQKIASLLTAQDLSKLKDSSIFSSLAKAIRNRPGEALTQLGIGGTVLATLLAKMGLPGIALALPPAYIVNKYGRSTLASGLRQAEKTLSSATRMAEPVIQTVKKATPAIKKSVDKVNILKQRFPDVYNKFSNVLDKAVIRGDSAVTATNYMLSQQYPEYREIMEQIDKEE